MNKDDPTGVPPARTRLDERSGRKAGVADHAAEDEAAALRAMHLMHQPAILLRNTAPAELRGAYVLVAHNAEAARHLRRAEGGAVGGALRGLFAEDTARDVALLADRATRAGAKITTDVFAPDPLTDLVGGPLVSVRATPAGTLVLVSWFAGHDSVEQDGVQVPIADRLVVAAAVDLLAGSGIGVFSVDLVSGEIVWSDGMYDLFGIARGTTPPNFDAALAIVSSETVDSGMPAWLELVRHGKPMDERFQFLPDHHGNWVRVIGRSSAGPDGFPQRVVGMCIAE
ncbi:hypothetical protein [Lentzea sp. E54]|uniref:hypothetical protein n=1 Tax=Lentzea xerophila TaxID=3435883 RepID=UPI003DA3A612